jgi:hypothetical protein
MGGLKMGQKSIALQKDIDEFSVSLHRLPTKYEPPVNHYFKDGMYCRETFTHADTMLVGATHTKASFNILTEGEVVISDGETEVKLKAPQIFISEPGSKKIAYCITDTIMVNVFRTSATSVEEAEKELYIEELYKENRICQE